MDDRERTPDIDELTRLLEKDDANGRARRAKRLRDLLCIMPVPEHGMSYMGGIESSICFEEVRRCYLDGSYLAVVLLCLAYVERELAAQLYATGWDPAANARLRAVLEKAHEGGWLSGEEWCTYQELAELRNSHAHFRAPLSETTLTARSVGENALPQELLKDDARQAVMAMARIVRRQSGRRVTLAPPARKGCIRLPAPFKPGASCRPPKTPSTSDSRGFG